jgi:hypothetical protein
MDGGFEVPGGFAGFEGLFIAESNGFLLFLFNNVCVRSD